MMTLNPEQQAAALRMKRALWADAERAALAELAADIERWGVVDHDGRLKPRGHLKQLALDLG